MQLYRELELWSKDDIVPSDLQTVCRISAIKLKELQAENEKLKSIIDKFVRHKYGCFVGEYNSITTGEMKGCDCGLSQPLKGKISNG